MKPFRYERATDAASAVALVTADPDARFLGGGTNLVDLMKLDVERPGLLVDVSGLDLPGIEVTADGGLRIGAQVRNSDLAVDPAVRERFPVLSQALLSGASGQLRNAATVGGQPVPADPVPLLPGRVQAVQQAGPRHRVPGARR